MESINWWSTDFGEPELENISQAIHNKKISQGTVTEEFESRFADMIGAKHAIAVPSGTAAIYIGLMAQGVKCRDEVITTDYSAIGTAHAAYMMGCKLKFVDIISADLPVIDPVAIEKAITDQTKAIIPVHYNGIQCDMEAIKKIADRHNLIVVEDAAQAMFSKTKGKFLGTSSKVGCFSLSVAKIISTGQGGLAVTNDTSIFEQMKKIRNQERGEYDIPCFNFKFTDILASIGLAQLERVPERIERQKENYHAYKDGLKNIESAKFLEVDLEAGQLPLWALVQCTNRDEIEKFLCEKSIYPLRFPKPLHTADYFENIGHYPNANTFAAQGLRLPCGPTQTVQNIQRVIRSLEEFEKL